MDEYNKYINALEILSKQQKLFPVEQIIALNLLDFEKKVPPNPKKALTEDEFHRIEAILLKFLSLNKGNLSIQCSVRISNCLLHIYRQQKVPQIWNLITLAKHPIQSVIFALGNIMNSIGQNVRSTIPGLVESLLTKSSINSFSSYVSPCFLLNSCFKRARDQLKKYVSLVFESYVVKALKSNDEPSQLLGIQLAGTLSKSFVIPLKRLISFAQTAFQHSTSSYVTDSTCYFIAKLAYYQIISKTKMSSKTSLNDEDIEAESTEWIINDDNHDKDNESNSIFKETFNIFLTFRTYFSIIFSHFLDLADTQFVHHFLQQLFSFVKRNHPSDVYQLISLFGPEVRKTLFDVVAAEKPPNQSQLFLLESLQYDENCLKEIAALSYQLVSSQDENQEATGAAFFTKLSNEDPHHASLYLETATLFLGKPPAPDPSFDSNFRGFTAIAVHILGSSSHSDELASSNLSNIQLFLGRALKTFAINPKATFATINNFIDDILSIDFQSAFRLMSVLPPNVLPIESISLALTAFSVLVEYENQRLTNQEQNQKSKSLKSNSILDQLKVIGATIGLFLSAQSPEIIEKFESATKIFWLLISIPFLQNLTSSLAILIGMPKAISNSGQLTASALLLLDHFKNIKPSDSFLSTIVKVPIPSPDSILSPYDFHNDNELKEKIFGSQRTPFYIPSIEKLPYYIFKYFPNLIANLQLESVPEVISAIFEIDNNNFSHSLLLSLVLDERTCKLLPGNFDSLLLEQIDINKHYQQIQVSAEALAVWLKYHKSAIPKVLAKISKWKTPSRCLIFASMASQHCFDGQIETLVQELQEIDEIALSTNNTSFALFAMYVAISFYSIELASFKIIDLQFPVFYSILSSTKSLIPYELSLLSLALSQSIAALSPQINLLPSLGKNDYIEQTNFDVLRSLIQAISQIPVHYAKEIMYNTMRYVFLFSRNIAEPSDIQFPIKHGKSLSLRLSACEAFSDMLKVIDPKSISIDYFSIVPQLLIVLQRSKDKRASEFILAIARSFVSLFISESTQNKDEPKSESQSENRDIDKEENRKKLKEWIKLTKTVLSSNALPNTGAATIEACDEVKACCLHVIRILLPMHVESKPFLNEALDDIMTSVTRAVEMKRPEVLKAAYQNLLSIIKLYSNLVNDNQSRLLELYDSQFALAIRIGFQCDLAVSGKFLSEYLEFHYSNLINSPTQFQTVLNGYVSGLNSCRQHTPEFIALASRICSIAKQNEIVASHIKPFAQSFITPFAKIIREAIKLFTVPKENMDWVLLSRFRANFELIYSNLLSAFIWLQTQYNSIEINFDEISSFVVSEIKNTDEKWRLKSAFEGLSSIYANSISNSNLNDSDVKSALEAISEQSHYELFDHKDLSQFILSCSKIISNKCDEETLSQLFHFSLDAKSFNSAALAYLLQKCSSNLLSSFDQILTQILLLHPKAKQNNISLSEQILALVTLMITSQPLKASSMLSMIISQKDIGIKSRLNLLRKVLIHCKNEIISDPLMNEIGNFAWRSFRSGGMQFLSSLILGNQPLIGAFIFLSNEMQIMDTLCQNDMVNTAVYLNFIHLGIKICSSLDFEIMPNLKQKLEECIKQATKIAMNCTDLWGNDAMNGNKIIFSSVSLLQFLHSNLLTANAFKQGFFMAGKRLEQNVVQSLEQQIIKDQRHQKAKKLATFSSNKRRTQMDDDGSDWQDLDDDDE